MVTHEASDYATAAASGLRATWIGHASTLVEIDGRRVLTDPIWSARSSPVSWLGPNRFHAPPVPLEALPAIDAVVISHDHFDHLDMATVQVLAARGAHFATQLFLQRRHRLFRRVQDHRRDLRTLRSSLDQNWRLRGHVARYPHDARRGRAGVSGCGWQAPAARALGHTFNLAFHAWNSPAERVLAAAQTTGAHRIVPRPGEYVTPSLTENSGPPPAVDVGWR